MQDSFFKNKNIFITGITGFIGIKLRERLSQLGANVYGASRTKTSENIFKVNVVDYATVDEIIQKKKIHICYHLAGDSLVETGQEDPYNVFTNNIQGTLNIIESGRKNKLEKIIIASTMHVYGRNKVPYFEGYTPRPSRPYETSKACTDLIAQSYADSYNLPILIPRFVNIYGPGDLHFDRIIPKTIRAIIRNQSPTMWGGSAVRDYLYIDDAVSAYLKLAMIDIKKIKGNRIFNFGSGNTITVEDLIKKIIELSGKRLKIATVDEGRSSEIKVQYVSWHKAQRLLGWNPQADLTSGLKETIAWYNRHLAEHA